jgi:NitT/TauT family transport system substrate-binding protein
MGSTATRRIVLAVVGIVLCVACAPSARPGTAPAQSQPAAPSAPAAQPLSNEPAKVTIATSASNSEAGWMVAEEKGYFKQAGLELDVQRGVSTNDRLALVAKGDIDMTNISPSAALFNAVKRGIDVKLVAAQQFIVKDRHGDVALVVRKQLYDNGTLDNISKLRGKTIAISGTGGIGNIQLDKTLRKAGLTSADVVIKHLNLDEMLPALAGGQVDAAVVFGSLQLQARKEGIGQSLIFADEMYPGAIVSIWLYSPSFARNRPDVGKRWMVPYLRGVRDYLDAVNKGIDRETVIAALIKHTGVKDRALYDEINLANLAPDGTIDLKVLAEIQDWFADEGLLTSGKVDLQQIVDTQFIDYANKELGPYRP